MQTAEQTVQTQIKQARILVVDDQPANVLLVEKVLALDGYKHIYSTHDSREAVSMFIEHDIDLLLLDLNMPYMDGFEVLEKIQQLDIDYAPVIVLTAQTDRESRVKALEKGARDYISKPFDRIELMTRIHNMLEVRLLNRAMKNQNQLLEQKVKERTRELEETRLEVIRRLGMAAEYRDDVTGNHILRMSKYAQVLARAAGMSEKEAEMLLNASPMHDIGKIGIPDRILLKPGKLDAEEWETMKSHVDIGVKILSGHDSALMVMAREIAQCHHEKWDGSGYPGGLQGEAIPLTARIVALSDVFDALTTERPYKKAWSVEDAMQYIRDNAGKHFDPSLVKILEQVLPQILEIRQLYNDHKQPLVNAV